MAGHMKQRSPIGEAPRNGPCEVAKEISAREKVGQFGERVWNSSKKLVPSKSGENDPVPFLVDLLEQAMFILVGRLVGSGP